MRAFRGRNGFVRGEVAAKLRLVLAPLERCLADEQIGVVREPLENRAGARVARVREGAVTLHPEGVRIDVVMHDLEAETRRPAASKGVPGSYR